MKIVLLFLVLAVGTTSSPLAVGDRGPDADTITEWVEAGKILPLEELLERHRERIPGRLLDLEVEREHGRIVYELEVIDEKGQVREIYLDAQTGEWLGQGLED